MKMSARLEGKLTAKQRKQVRSVRNIRGDGIERRKLLVVGVFRRTGDKNVTQVTQRNPLFSACWSCGAGPLFLHALLDGETGAFGLLMGPIRARWQSCLDGRPKFPGSESSSRNENRRSGAFLSLCCR